VVMVVNRHQAHQLGLVKGKTIAQVPEVGIGRLLLLSCLFGGIVSHAVLQVITYYCTVRNDCSRSNGSVDSYTCRRLTRGARCSVEGNQPRRSAPPLHRHPSDTTCS